MPLAVPRSTEAGMGCPGLNTEEECRRIIHSPHSGFVFLFLLPAYTTKNFHLLNTTSVMNNACCSCFIRYCCLELPLCNVHVCTEADLLYFLFVHQQYQCWICCCAKVCLISMHCTLVHCSAPCSQCRAHFKASFPAFQSPP